MNWGINMIEKEITDTVKAIYNHLEDEDINADLLQDLKEISSEIISVSITEHDDDELKIEFALKENEWVFLYLERDEDDDCWVLV
jgi:hypothetical protein